MYDVTNEQSYKSNCGEGVAVRYLCSPSQNTKRWSREGILGTRSSCRQAYCLRELLPVARTLKLRQICSVTCFLEIVVVKIIMMISPILLQRPLQFNSPGWLCSTECSAPLFVVFFSLSGICTFLSWIGPPIKSREQSGNINTYMEWLNE